MHRTIYLLALLLGAPTASLRARPSATSPVADARALWTDVAGYITQAAEDVPEADYAFRPTPEVRSFGQLIAHIAGAQRVMCGAALGESGANEGDIEKTTTAKADLVAALKASNDYCARAYALSDADAGGMTKLFGQEHTRLFALMMNATHDNEHYGNIVTYMRMKGMVPPSSRPRAR